jgi:hypothetical protein
MMPCQKKKQPLGLEENNPEKSRLVSYYSKSTKTGNDQVLIATNQ